ncbi:DUF1344 domain-containing protein [Aminobacter sp. HY435]|uniref:DUF1344 domain-containing protein n=1 Tax=Aminobacter sp. HY435 TaxID=2970917 RepID=UPI0022B9756A|nr:DUF1344 domain-containing protein [Aminobacter sp. HY435]
MRKLILAAASLALMSGAALATEVNGTVVRFNSHARVITLDNGKSFTVPRDVALPAIQVGSRVSIQLDDERDKVENVFASHSMM